MIKSLNDRSGADIKHTTSAFSSLRRESSHYTNLEQNDDEPGRRMYFVSLFLYQTDYRNAIQSTAEPDAAVAMLHPRRAWYVVSRSTTPSTWCRTRAHSISLLPRSPKEFKCKIGSEEKSVVAAAPIPPHPHRCGWSDLHHQPDHVSYATVPMLSWDSEIHVKDRKPQ